MAPTVWDKGGFNRESAEAQAFAKELIDGTMNFAWEQSLVAKAEAEEKQRQLEQFIADAEQAQKTHWWSSFKLRFASTTTSRKRLLVPTRGGESSGRVPEAPPVGAGRVRRHHQQEHDAQRP